ncbi:cardiolipin synthase [Halodesulfovibrio sp.]|jgi:cardiolipin synthase|uniref:cardiolipin synthase n=1 Tax=Halodesulfovibrio sp. TaxID=1912772 RepID=UPI0025DC0271|nr:cardiolipin synthase [Halodesulfovibrio sp.]MCT4534129.1 cardiolipin synthase [Halodesulfovibrio sp.]
MSPYVLLFNFFFILSLIGAGHALLTRKQPNSALVWVTVCLSLPVVGVLAYVVFGVNRVRRSATRLREEFEQQNAMGHLKPPDHRAHTCMLKELPAELIMLEKIGRALTGTFPLKGNSIQPLYNGKEAYPAMLEAIRSAKESVYLSTFLLDKDPVGRKFVKSLIEAHNRGVHVAVLIDGFGLLLSWRSVIRMLKKNGVPATIFLPLRLIPPQIRLNLRNHRKLLAVDGKIGFTGGMNIGGTRNSKGHRRLSDMQYRLTGPIVSQLQQIFMEDWAYARGAEHQPLPAPMDHTGTILARVLKDGPDNPDNPLQTSIIATIGAAKHSVRIITPYFLPSAELLSVLSIAALRGIAVTIVLPVKSNWPFVHWASRNYFKGLLESGVRIFYQPQPFCHTKLLVIDDCYVQFGSANMDPRSLLLNFELNVEVLDSGLARQLIAHVDDTVRRSQEVAHRDMVSRPLPIRIRDAFFWLFSPYL